MTGLVPQPDAPAYVSPSVVLAYEACPAKAGFRLDPALERLRRTGPAAAVGSVAHEVLASAGSGVPFDEAWSAAAERWYHRLVQEWAPATPPPPPQWQNWALTRERVRLQYSAAAREVEYGATVTDDAREARRERDVAKVASRVLPARTSPAPAALPWRERPLFDSENGLMGIPDLVEDRGGRPVVVDFKTGLGSAEVSAETALQLRLYGTLVRTALGGSIPELEVRDATGRASVVDNREALVDEALQRARGTRKALTAAQSGEVELRGSPDPLSCGGCPYRAVCRAYLSAPPEARGKSRAFAFRVLRVDAEGPRSGVDARVLAPADLAQQVRLTAFPFPAHLEVGSIWGASDFELLSGQARGHWTTLVLEVSRANLGD